MAESSELQIKIQDGRLIDPVNKLDRQTDLYIAKGRVAGIGTAPDGFRVDQTIDASGLTVIPGLIDLCVHTREPGQEHKAELISYFRTDEAKGRASDYEIYKAGDWQLLHRCLISLKFIRIRNDTSL